MMDSRSTSRQQLKGARQPPLRRRFALTTGPHANGFARRSANSAAQIRRPAMRQTELPLISDASIRRKIYSQISSKLQRQQLLP
jgi:hypothetical protein